MQRKALKMARNYRKDAGGGDLPVYPTPTPIPPIGPDPTRRRRTPTLTPTPWPPKMYGTPTPEYLEYLGYPMGVREMGGGSGFGYNGTGGGGGIASKRMRKASDKPLFI